MLERLKEYLRITETDFDNEIEDLIAQGQLRLAEAGVHTSHFARDGNDLYVDELILGAVVVYVKANFGWNNPDRDNLMMSFNNRVEHMTQSETYLQARA